MSSAATAILIVIIAVAIIFIVVPLLVASAAMGWWGGGFVHPGFSAGGWWALGALIFWVAFWIAVIVAIVFLIRWAAGRDRTGPHPRADEALETLRRRYASGEISREEFEQHKRDLQQPRP